ncbi:MAG: hypothetical protein VW258_02165 [Thalassolituus sp.]
MKVVIFPFIAFSLTLSMNTSATPRPMMMMDDSALKDTRVDYVTGLEKSRVAASEDEGRVSNEQHPEVPDQTGDKASMTPAVPVPVLVPAANVKVDIRPR